jgi:WD40 repeat protein
VYDDYLSYQLDTSAEACTAVELHICAYTVVPGSLESKQVTRREFLRPILVLIIILMALLSACSTSAGKPEHAVVMSPMHSIEDQDGQVVGLAFIPGGQDLVVAANNFDKGRSSLRIYNMLDGSQVRTLDVPSPTHVLLSPDGKTLAVGNYRSVLLWQVSDWTLLNTISPHPSDASDRTFAAVAFDFSPDGVSLATRSSTYPTGGQVDLWRTVDGAHIKTVVTQAGEGDYMVLTTDGKTVVTESDTQAQLWNVSDGSLVRTLGGATATLGSNLAVSPNGETLATGSTILWKLADGTRLRELPTEAVIASLAFSPDSELLATGAWSADDRVKIWAMPDGQLLKEVNGGGGTVVSVVFSSDGTTLASGTANGAVRLWKVK